LAISGAAPAVAHSGSTPDSISVSGHGSVEGTPDTLISDMTVHAKRDSAQAALDAAGQIVQQVVDALEANGVASKDIQTSGITVGPRYAKHHVLTGYRAEESLTARMHPLDTAGHAIDAASAAGGNALSIDYSYLTLSHKAAFEAKARAKAFENAEATAQQYADLAHRQLGRVMRISGVALHGPAGREVALPNSGPTTAGGGAAAPASGIPVNPGQQSVSSSVHVVWAMK
jgi:uncharacterized protein YggE